MTAFARWLLLFAVVASPAACVPAARHVAAVPVPVPDDRYRIIAAGSGQETTFERMAARLAGSKVVFFGEQHDDPGTHAAEVELLHAIGP